jgi:hypothetical protein
MTEKYQDILASLEVDRQKALKNRRRTVIGGAASLALAAGWVYFAVPADDQVNFIWGAVVILALITFGIFYYITESYETAFKKNFGAKVLKEHGFSLKVKPMGISLNDHKGILPSYDKASFEDLCVGKHEGIKLSFLEATLKKRRRSGKRTYYETVFAGIIATFDYNVKELTTALFIRKNNNFFDLPIPHLFQSGSKVKLEDPIFSKKFEVFCDSQIESRYILTPLMMERFLDVASKYAGVEAIFNNGELHMALRTSRDLFDPNINAIVDASMVDDILADLHTLTAIIATLKLKSDVHI